MQSKPDELANTSCHIKNHVYYMHYIEHSNTNISPKYLGIQLKTHELKWARPLTVVAMFLASWLLELADLLNL
jgi:hypothetical protein